MSKMYARNKTFATREKYREWINPSIYSCLFQFLGIFRRCLSYMLSLGLHLYTRVHRSIRSIYCLTVTLSRFFYCCIYCCFCSTRDRDRYWMKSTIYDEKKGSIYREHYYFIFVNMIFFSLLLLLLLNKWHSDSLSG